jgi:mannose-1-phosphate guanylyltransferase
LFKDENGNYESMVQRVYRQINDTDKNAFITIATAKSQVSAIKNQLGDMVSICVEPCRKDTFPAISLAASFLYYEKKVKLDEPVAICPVDPYAEHNYYRTVNDLCSIAASGDAKLVLMGITPTYPSEKYGYIIPNTQESISSVKEFKEKPNKELAEEYIKAGALWNAGVFIAKLGYFIDKAHERIDFRDYNDLYTRYEELEKISFDYAVVEREASVFVGSYTGQWMDIGTWNTLSEVMAEPAKGNVILADNNVNTNIINELELPIICMGLKDIVVAASNDGILVADKEQSGYLKSYVEQINQDVMFAEKSWGTFTVIDILPHSLTIRVKIKAGSSMKYHKHEYRDEIWTIVSGKGRCFIDGNEQTVNPGDVVKIIAGSKHTIIADEDLSVIEVQIGEDIHVKDKTVYQQEEVGVL